MRNELRSVSPADPKDEIGRFPISDADEVDRAVARAQAAFPAWRNRPAEERFALLRRFAALASERTEELARLIAREVGKAIWDARGEAKLLAPKVAVTLAEGMELVREIVPGPGARATFHPRGTLAVLGPFNFPAHLPNGHIVPALATGNTVVFKPSELSPAVGAWMTAVWQEADLPEGVLELVQGRGETGEALATHPGIDGVLFTGSWNTGRALSEALLDQPNKILALEMGGKNAIVVMDDADLSLALAETVMSICATTGQRCSCASRVFVQRAHVDEFSERLTAMLAKVSIGAPLDETVFMGPLTSRAAFDKVKEYRALASDAGGERLLCVEPDLPAPFVGPGLVRFEDTDQAHRYQRDEIFGPEAAIYAVNDLAHAITAVNDSDFGLVASLFTRDRAAWEHAVGRVRTGLLNWNKGTIGASGKLPFGGLRKSGNDRPAGLHATIYCTTPQAHLENEDGAFDPESLPPGMPRP